MEEELRISIESQLKKLWNEREKNRFHTVLPFVIEWLIEINYYRLSSVDNPKRNLSRDRGAAPPNVLIFPRPWKHTRDVCHACITCHAHTGEIIDQREIFDASTFSRHAYVIRRRLRIRFTREKGYERARGLGDRGPSSRFSINRQGFVAKDESEARGSFCTEESVKNEKVSLKIPRGILI